MTKDQIKKVRDALFNMAPYRHDLIKPRNEALDILDAAIAQPTAWECAFEVIGCFEAAYTEGLEQVLAETADLRLKDLVERRLLHAMYAAQSCPPITVAAPAPSRMDRVFDAIRAERAHQDAKWGTLEQKRQSCAGYIMVMEWELNEAKAGWMKNVEGRHSALSEIVQVAATAVACLEQYGHQGNPL